MEIVAYGPNTDQEGMSGTATEGVLSMEEWERLADIRKGTTMVSPAGKVDKKLIKISGFFELESMKNVEVLIFDCSTSSREKLPIQIMYEDNVISTYFPGRKVPDRFVSMKVGSKISFTVTLSPYGYSRGLDLCLVYSLPADIDFLRRRPLKVEIRIPSRGIVRYYSPRCHGIPGTGEDMVWLIHWIVGDLFKEGDVVLVKFEIDIALSGKIKGCGVSLMPCLKVDALQCWGTLRELLKSDAFQVMILQDRYKEEDQGTMARVYTPYNTSNTRTSDTLGFRSHRDTPKVSHGKVSRQLINISGFMEWDHMENMDVLIVDSITSSRKKLPIQILYEHGIISTYFTGREVPDRFVSKNVGSMISFTVTLSPSGYYRGLDLCLVYTLPDDVFFSQIPLHVEIYIRSSGKKKFYTPRYYGIPGTGGDMVWQMHWLEEDLFKEGDEVQVMFNIHPKGKIKECGVHLLLCSKDTVPTYWRSLRGILESNLQFQVLPTPDSHELVKDYTPNETLYTRKSYTDSLGLPIWETPKISPVGKVDKKLIKISGFFELDSMKNVEMLIVDCIMSTRKKLPIQIIFEHDIISTYFPGREVPDRFVSKKVGSVISFTVTLSHYGYCRGLDLCLVYSLPADTVNTDFWGKIVHPLRVEIRIVNRGIERYYRPRCYGIPGTDEDMVWLIHWVEGDLFKEGDVVLVKFETVGKIKGCGVSLSSCPKFEALQYWGTLKESLESNAFQVLPLPDRKSEEEKDSKHLRMQLHQMHHSGSTSGTAPEGGVLPKEELVPDLFPEDEESSTKLTEDLSGTNMYTLPHYIFKLVALQKLKLRSGAILMMELPPEIGELTNLEVLDLEGTEILCLPKEIAKLVKLTCLKVSFYGHANQTVIPRKVLSNLSRLKELIIDVTPYGEWWDVEVKAIIDDLRNLKELTTLKLYLPTPELLKYVISIFRGLANFRYVTSTFLSLANFRFSVGRQEEHFISRLPRDVEEEFNNREKLEKGLRFINGDCIPNEITKVLKHADAFFLQRHWTAESLSEFGHENLEEVKFFLVMECNEFRTIIDSEKLYQGKDGSAESEDFPGFDEAMVLGPLERLIIRYMKNMESIWKGPVGIWSLSNLKSLALHTCPNLTTLFTIDMLRNLTNLEELIVEDCPKINSLVSHTNSGSESVLFLPNLKKISLLWLPGLVSISSGLEIAPKLERMVIYYCPKLEKLSTVEVSRTELKVIKGEKEWWDALKWYESDVSTELEYSLARHFIPLRRDGDLMAQLTED